DAKVEGGALLVNATLESGWHVNSHRPSEDYLIATTVTVDPAPGLQAGEPKYPEGMRKKLAFAEKPLSAYEGSCTVTSPRASAPSGEIAGGVEFQACSDTQCLPPASVKFKAAAAAAAAGGEKLAGGAVALSQGPAAGSAESSTSAAGASQ